MKHSSLPAKNLLKSISLMTCLCFVFTTTGFSAPGAQSNSTKINQNSVQPFALTEALEIPSDLGHITARHQEKGYRSSEVKARRGPFIIYIQDAHGQYEAQKNIHHTIKYLHQTYGVNLLLIEGAAGELLGQRVQLFNQSQRAMKAGQILAQNAVMGGPELALLSDALTDRALSAHGVEDTRLYRTNILSYREVFEGHSQSNAFLTKLKLQLISESSHHFNKKLKSFFRDWAFYQNDQKNLMEQLKVLQHYAYQDLRVDLSNITHQFDWPQLLRYVKLRNLSKDLNQKQVKKEQTTLLKWLEARGISESDKQRLVAVTNGKSKNKSALSTRRYFENFYNTYAPQGFSFEAYSEFSKQAGIAILSDEINASLLSEEIHRMTNAILSVLAKTDREKEIIKEYRTYLILKKLFALELIRSDYHKILKDPSSYNRLIETYGNSEIKALYQKALDFYHIAKARETAMLKNSIKVMREQGREQAILIAGGFHAEGFQDQMKTNNISFVEITPHMTKVESTKNYHNLMTLQGNFSLLTSHARGVTPIAASSLIDQLAPGHRSAVIEPAYQAAANAVIGGDENPTQAREGYLSSPASQLLSADESNRSSKTKNLMAASETRLNRRDFLKAAGGATTTLGLTHMAGGQEGKIDKPFSPAELVEIVKEKKVFFTVEGYQKKLDTWKQKYPKAAKSVMVWQKVVNSKKATLEGRQILIRKIIATLKKSPNTVYEKARTDELTHMWLALLTLNDEESEILIREIAPALEKEKITSQDPFVNLIVQYFRLQKKHIQNRRQKFEELVGIEAFMRFLISVHYLEPGREISHGPFVQLISITNLWTQGAVRGLHLESSPNSFQLLLTKIDVNKDGLFYFTSPRTDLIRSSKLSENALNINSLFAHGLTFARLHLKDSKDVFAETYAADYRNVILKINGQLQSATSTFRYYLRAFLELNQDTEDPVYRKNLKLFLLDLLKHFRGTPPYDIQGILLESTYEIIAHDKGDSKFKIDLVNFLNQLSKQSFEENKEGKTLQDHQASFQARFWDQILRGAYLRIRNTQDMPEHQRQTAIDVFTELVSLKMESDGAPTVFQKAFFEALRRLQAESKLNELSLGLDILAKLYANRKLEPKLRGEAITVLNELTKATIQDLKKEIITEKEKTPLLRTWRKVIPVILTDIRQGQRVPEISKAKPSSMVNYLDYYKELYQSAVIGKPILPLHELIKTWSDIYEHDSEPGYDVSADEREELREQVVSQYSGLAEDLWRKKFLIDEKDIDSRKALTDALESVWKDKKIESLTTQYRKAREKERKRLGPILERRLFLLHFSGTYGNRVNLKFKQNPIVEEIRILETFHKYASDRRGELAKAVAVSLVVYRDQDKLGTEETEALNGFLEKNASLKIEIEAKAKKKIEESKTTKGAQLELDQSELFAFHSSFDELPRAASETRVLNSTQLTLAVSSLAKGTLPPQISRAMGTPLLIAGGYSLETIPTAKEQTAMNEALNYSLYDFLPTQQVSVVNGPAILVFDLSELDPARVELLRRGTELRHKVIVTNQNPEQAIYRDLTQLKKLLRRSLVGDQRLSFVEEGESLVPTVAELSLGPETQTIAASRRVSIKDISEVKHSTRLKIQHEELKHAGLNPQLLEKRLVELMKMMGDTIDQERIATLFKLEKDEINGGYKVGLKFARQLVKLLQARNEMRKSA